MPQPPAALPARRWRPAAQAAQLAAALRSSRPPKLPPFEALSTSLHMMQAVPDLGPAVNAVVRRCLGVSQGEDVLVIVDQGTREIGEALQAEAADAGADAVLALMDERENDGTEPPRVLASAMEACDVFIAPTS